MTYTDPNRLGVRVHCLKCLLTDFLKLKYRILSILVFTKLGYYIYCMNAVHNVVFAIPDVVNKSCM